LRNFQYKPDHDSELVRRYKRAGLIIVGKTNTCEFGLLPTTEPVAFGPTKNPWNVNCTAGGSSGGSAAAVASRMVPMAYGNDGGGSIRIPASCCGVFGLKPTRARISMAPDSGDMLGGLASEHAITLSVRDSAALLDATAGCLSGDPYWAPPIARPFIKEVGADVGRLRIAFSSKAFGVSVHEDCVKAVKDAALLCDFRCSPGDSSISCSMRQQIHF
jgi:amidase